MRRLTPPLLLILALMGSAGCARDFDNLYDFDGDGSLDEHDCGTTDPSIYPGAPDTVGDDIDQDCDGSDGVDLDGDGHASLLSGGTDCDDSNADLDPADSDADGYSTCTGDCDDSDPALTPADVDGDYYSSCTGDCDDGNSQLNPEQEEVCDLIDNDCDGVLLEGEVDADGDGDPACNDCDDNNALLDALDLDGDSFSLCDGDCNDDLSAFHADLIYPQAADLVANDIDNNCDGIPGTDADGDGHASLASGGADCDDSTDTTYPTAPDEIDPSSLDSNCDGIDGVDADGDGWASNESVANQDCNDDPNDLYAAVTFPGAADLVGDGIDTNCDGMPGTDNDQDTFAAINSGGTDCDDTSDTINPDVPDSVGDGIDNNCDGIDGVDADGDLHASEPSLGDDCDDTDPATFLGAADSWDNGVDEDCDGCDSSLPPVTDASGNLLSRGDGIDEDCDGYAHNGPGANRDCNDDPTDSEASLTHPSAADLVANGVDNNCDGIPGVDADGDQYASLLNDPGGDDCNDDPGDPNAVFTYPGAPDNPDPAGLDTDCDQCDASLPAVVDASGVIHVRGDGVDADCDGYPQNGSGSSQDCDDANPAVYPGSTEIWDSPAAGRDANCDGDLYNHLANADTSFLSAGLEQFAGYSVSSAGDVDGDGLSDVLIGMPGTWYDGGAALWPGSSISSGGSFEVEHADWFRIGESMDDMYGISVSSAGDVDGDGLDDLLIGADRNGENGSAAGKTYLYLGASINSGGGCIPCYTCDCLYQGDADALFVGENADDNSGYAVSSAGDVDGDGLGDLIIGAWGNDDGASDAGKSYLFLGASIAAGGTFDLSAADAAFVGENEQDTYRSLCVSYWPTYWMGLECDPRTGSVSSAGDVDGDGLDDLLIGASRNDDGGSDAGKSYLFFGASIAAGGTFNLSAADVSFIGETASDRSGNSVSSAGDVDGDGLSDVLIGAYDADTTYLFLAANITAGSTFTLSAADASFVGDLGQYGRFGLSVSSAGDVDGDGLDDLLIGAPEHNSAGTTGWFAYGAGKTFLFLGSSIIQGLSIPGGGTFNVGDADAAFAGENPNDKSGYSVASAGDVNGDGLDDLLIGAFLYTGNSNEGKTHLLLSPYPTPDYAGLWTLAPATTYACGPGFVSAQLDHLVIDHVAPYATVPGMPELTMEPATAQPGLLEGGFVTSATPDSFEVTRNESLSAGACTATWSLTGSYTGPNTLSADFTATFTGSCGDCTNQSFPVTATR